MSLITGIHHVCIKCVSKEEYDKAMKFYHETLEMEIIREWAMGAHLDTGNGIMEVFIDESLTKLEQGTIRHFSLATNDTDAVVEKVRNAGYPITVEPKDIHIPTERPCIARIAFCIGPVGEEIEIFDEK